MLVRATKRCWIKDRMMEPGAIFEIEEALFSDAVKNPKRGCMVKVDSQQKQDAPVIPAPSEAVNDKQRSSSKMVI